MADIKEKTAHAIDYLKAEARKFLRKEPEADIKREIKGLLRNNDFRTAARAISIMVPPAYHAYRIAKLLKDKDQLALTKATAVAENIGLYAGVGGLMSVAGNLANLSVPLGIAAVLSWYGLAPAEWGIIRMYQKHWHGWYRLLKDPADRISPKAASMANSLFSSRPVARISMAYHGKTDGMEMSGWAEASRAGYFIAQWQVLGYAVAGYLLGTALGL